MIRPLYNWTLRLAEHPRALWFLALVAFAESSFFPIPPDVVMIPMILAAPRRAFVIAGVATLASVCGGLFGYAIGFFLFDWIGEDLLRFYGTQESFDAFRASYTQWGAWAVLIVGVTPLPYKVITILSGSMTMNLWVFMLASLAARGLRFFILAALLWKFGPPIRGFVEKRLGLVFGLMAALLVAGFLVLRFVS